MARNFFRRIELCFPVLDPVLKKRVIREGLLPYFEDNTHAWVMLADGNYERLRPRRGAKGRSAQEELLAALASGGGEVRAPTPVPVLKPAQTPT
jgi:polyphosphate kinase